MKIKKYLPLILIIFAVIVLLALSAIFKKPETILFFGDTCPHCKNVDKYLEENNIRETIKFQELEVYQNKINANLMAQKAKTCNIDSSNGIGVPFLFDGENCLMGDEDIINWFKGQSETNK